MHLIFWFLLLMSLVHHLEGLPLIVQLILKKSQPPGIGKALTSQVKKYNVTLQQTYYYIFFTDTRPVNVFEKAIDLNKLVFHIVAQTNLYASKNRCSFVTNDAEMKASFEMNSIMSINKLRSIEHYWSTEKYNGNQGLRNVMTKSRFKEILSNIPSLIVIQLTPTTKVIS